MQTQRTRIADDLKHSSHGADTLAALAAHRGTPQPDATSALQNANDLLLLIRDEAIWRPLLSAGLDPDAQIRLAQSLEAARRSYTRWRAARDNRLAIKQLEAALIRLRHIMSAIGKVGCCTFSTTDSLCSRFGRGMQGEGIRVLDPKPAA